MNGYPTSEDSFRRRSASVDSRVVREGGEEVGGAGPWRQKSPSISFQSKSATGECW